MIFPSAAIHALPLVPVGKSAQSKRCSVVLIRTARDTQVRGSLRCDG